MPTNPFWNESAVSGTSPDCGVCQDAGHVWRRVRGGLHFKARCPGCGRFEHVVFSGEQGPVDEVGARYSSH